MVPDFLNYKISLLNPGLKLLVPAIFLVGSFYFFRVRNQYQGEIGKVVRRLIMVGLIGALANFFRFGADYWFEDLKWGESICFLIFALANVYAVWPLLAFVRGLKAEAKK
jgi:hypothetical protein